MGEVRRESGYMNTPQPPPEANKAKSVRPKELDEKIPKFGPMQQAISCVVYKVIEEARVILEVWGCQFLPGEFLFQQVILYPKGTTRQYCYPTTLDFRYRIILPNGRRLEEVENRLATGGIRSVYICTKEDGKLDPDMLAN